MSIRNSRYNEFQKSCIEKRGRDNLAKEYKQISVPKLLEECRARRIVNADAKVKRGHKREHLFKKLTASDKAFDEVLQKFDYPRGKYELVVKPEQDNVNVARCSSRGVAGLTFEGSGATYRYFTGR